MKEPGTSFFPRFSLALRTFFRIVFDAGFAASVLRLDEQPDSPAGERMQPSPPAFKEAVPDSALQLLGLLQQEGRFVDFLEEDVGGFSDAEVGAAARVIHEGCRKVIHDNFSIVPIRKEPEGSRLTLPQGFDSSSMRLTGNVVGKPPFSGALIHRGWRATDVRLPKVAEGHDMAILAPAEVEL